MRNFPKLGLIGAAISVVLIGLATPALAHSELTDADPKANSVLRQVPTEVTLSFSDSVEEQGGAITVTGPDGARYDEKDTFAASGTQASISLTPIEAAGQFIVAYRVLSGDGHVVQGSYGFRLVPLDTNPTPPTMQAAEPTVTPETSPASAEDEGGAGLVWVLGLGGIGVALIAAMIAVFSKRRRG